MLDLKRSAFIPCALAAVLLAAVGCSKESRKESHLQRAQNYLADQKLEEASIEFRNVLRLDATNYTAIRHLGLVYHEQGRPVLAYAFLGRAKAIQPEDPEVRLTLGQTLFTGRKFREARAEADYVLSKQPTNNMALVLLGDTALTTNDVVAALTELERLRPQSDQATGFHLARATLLFRMGDQTGAESSLRDALRLDPKSGSVHVGLGNLFWARNDLENAALHFKQAWDLAPLRSPQKLRYAIFKLNTGDIESGKTLLTELVAGAPDTVPPRLMLAEIALGQRDFDGCANHLRKILEPDPANYEALLLSGRLKIIQGDAALAVSEFEKLAATYQNVPQILFQLATARMLNKDLTGALSSLNQVVGLDPYYSDAVIMLSELHLRRGDPAAAIIALNRLLQKIPDIPAAQLLLANAYLARGSQNDAITVYDTMMTLFPSSGQPALHKGRVLLRQGNTNAARVLFEKALELSADYMPAMEQIVDLDLVSNRIQAALDRAERWVAKHPTNALPRLLLAKVHITQTNYPPAEIALKKVLELDPNQRNAYLMLARIYVHSNQEKAALENLQGVVDKNPEDTVAWMQIGMIHDQLQDYDAARDAYEKLLKVNPNFSLALNNLAYLYTEQFKDLNKAYQLAQRARDLAPFDPYAADTVGWILYKRGDFPWALSLIRESVDNLPRPNAEVFYHLGMTHYMMGEEDPAREAFSRAQNLNVDFPGKEAMEKYLGVLNLDPRTAGPTMAPQLEAALKINPGDPIILSKLAALYEQEGNLQNAVQAYENALKQNSKNLGAIVNLSRLYADRLNDPERALELAKTARNLAPDDAHVAHRIGQLVYDAGDHAWSLSLLQESARKLSDDPAVYDDLARAFLSVGQIQEARGAVQLALKLDPNFPGAAEAKLFLEMTDVALNPASAEAAEPRVAARLAAAPDDLAALMVLALIRQQQGKPAEAQRMYEAILARYKLFTPAHKQLALLLAIDLKDFARAYEHAVKARTAFPGDPEVAKALGIVSFERGDFNRALQLLKEATLKRVADAEAFFYLGKTHGKLNQPNERVAALQRAIELDPNAAFVPEARQLIGAP